MVIDLYLQNDLLSDDLSIDEDGLVVTIATALQYVHHVQSSVLTDKGIHSASNIEIAVIITDTATSQTLNHQYRQKDKPTNVLSFVSEVPDEILPSLSAYPLGDLVICLPIVLQEAIAQQKTPKAHLQHLVVHGVLHLLGYDHEISEAEAVLMESLEIAILAKLGIANPYADEDKSYS